MFRRIVCIDLYVFLVVKLSVVMFFVCCFFFFKQKTAYEMRISDWSSDVCSSDLHEAQVDRAQRVRSCGRVDHFAGLHLDALEQQIRAQQRPEHGAEDRKSTRLNSSH